MKHLFSIFFLFLSLVFLGSLSANAKTQADKTLYIYVQTPSQGGTVRISTPVSKTVSLSGTNGAIIKSDDYLYIGGILLDFETSGISASKITITCYDANYSKTIPNSSHVQEFIPLSTAQSTSIYITFSK